MQTVSGKYADIAKSQKFVELLKHKRKFLVPMTVFFLVFYFLLPVLTSFTTVLNAPAIGPISWAWVFAFAQFIMTWVLCTLYSSRAARFDALVDEVRQEAQK
jgi:uncharacterized membrane protein (DUF485 family)